MSKEILLVVDAVSNEKEIEREVIFEAMEAALAMATKKKHNQDIDIRVSIDRKTGDYETFRRWHILENAEDIEAEDRQYSLDEARALKSDAAVGEYIEQLIDSVEFGRIAAQTAKQVIVQKVREAERARVVEAFTKKVGEVVLGVVKRVERGNVYLDLGGNAEAFVAKDDLIPREAVRPGDRMRGYLREVRSEPRGPQIFVSRTVPEFLVELFKIEVPEVGQDMISIMGASRDPGVRAKIAVRSNDPRLDPIGACVGMRGSRVQSVSNELGGERVDIVLWDENPAQYVVNAMSPAEVVSIVVDEESKSMDIAVPTDKLSQAIGRGGQNVRLASELTGWSLNVMDVNQASAKSEEEAQTLRKIFMDQLDVDSEVANILVQEGFSSIEEVAYVPKQELMEIEEFGEQIVDELRGRARDALLTKAIAHEESAGDSEPTAELLAMEGMDDDLAYKLAGKGIVTLDDLAEQSVDDLLEIEGMDETRAAALIMKARERWFAEAEQAQAQANS